ncbi:MAG: 1-phosphofructokinase family hexose kinase [Limisphaerales bacterium]|jgi:1-phosphofructokinase family hexose kinase
MSVLVIGLNPAVDEEWRVESVNPDEKTEVREKRSWAGGKPPNVGRWLRRLGVKSTLLMPLGGAGGRRVARHLREEKVKLRIVRLEQETRTNVMITPDRGHQLRFNPPGPVLSRTEWGTVYAETRKALGSHRVVICSGSLPARAPIGTYARLVREGNAAGVTTILDCDGPALTCGVKAKPFLLKPNLFELNGWVGEPLTNKAARIEGAREMSRQSGGWVLLSLDRGGAILINHGENFLATAKAPPVKALNTVGAGDALLAAAAQQIDQKTSPESWLRWGVAAGTAYVTQPAGTLPALKTVEKLVKEVVVQRRGI